MGSSWAEEQQSDSSFQNPEDQQSILVLHNLLQDIINEKDAASSIATNYAPRLQRGNTMPWSLWTLLCSIILHRESDLGGFQKLVNMLMHMSNLPDVVCGDKLVMANKRVFWRDLPELSFYFRENAMSKSIP